MPRVTKAMLVEENQRLRDYNLHLSRKIEALESAEKIKKEAVDLALRGGESLRIALERTSNAMAHVITDLKRRQP